MARARVLKLGAPFLLAVVAAAASPADAAATDEDRVIRAAQGFMRERPPGARLEPDRFAEIRASAEHTTALAKTAEPGVSHTLSVGDHWIYEADVALYDDLDGDGYYPFVSLRVDADTYFNSSFVYAVIYLSEDGEIFEEFFATDDFEINGATSDDEYFVETELVSGYPPGLYDVLIELYDADTGVYMDEYGPAQSESLELLPLEDLSFDEPPVVIVEEHGGGGAISWWMLATLIGATVARRSRRYRRTALSLLTVARLRTADVARLRYR